MKQNVNEYKHSEYFVHESRLNTVFYCKYKNDYVYGITFILDFVAITQTSDFFVLHVIRQRNKHKRR